MISGNDLKSPTKAVVNESADHGCGPIKWSMQWNTRCDMSKRRLLRNSISEDNVPSGALKNTLTSMFIG